MELIKNNATTGTEADKPVAPQVNDIAPPTTTAPEAKAAQPDDANVATAPSSDDAEPTKASHEKEAARPKPIKPPKPQKAHGTGGAIFAAVVIVLALGAMFTYAYLRSQNISLR